MQLFYAHQVDGDHAYLDDQESRHCIKVLRHRRGDELMAMDGQGLGLRCRLQDADPRAAMLLIEQRLPGWGEPPWQIELAFSPLRLRDRLEWLVEKAVELGVSRLQPVRCHYTDKYKAKYKADRLQTIILTATKQCLRSRLPVLAEEVGLAEYLANTAPEGMPSLIARAGAPAPISQWQPQIAAAGAARLLIGPEGDFSEEEFATATDTGWIPVQLGQQRLRAETAALQGLAVIKHLGGY